MQRPRLEPGRRADEFSDSGKRVIWVYDSDNGAGEVSALSRYVSSIITESRGFDKKLLWLLKDASSAIFRKLLFVWISNGT